MVGGSAVGAAVGSAVAAVVGMAVAMGASGVTDADRVAVGSGVGAPGSRVAWGVSGSSSGGCQTTVQVGGAATVGMMREVALAVGVGRSSGVGMGTGAAGGRTSNTRKAAPPA